ncbi:MAG: hypothetical protein JST30_16195 [Armatimonadetes bacterium]|nr:hypothetical protein [Armatimonadota bacterium]
MGEVVQAGSMFAAVSPGPLWRAEPFARKFRSILTRRWIPLDGAPQASAKTILAQEVFGEEEDFGPELMELMYVRFSRDREGVVLTDSDSRRCDALKVFTMTTYLRLGQVTESWPPLNLGIGSRSFMLASLVFPMEIKIPVVSLKWFIDVDFNRSVHSIRASGHPQADALVAFLYEILFLQQKTSIAMQEYLRLATYTADNKRAAAMINAEVDAIMQADLIFTYLKATVEKSMAILGLVFGVKDLEDRKNHASRVRALEAAIPDTARETHYGAFVLEMIKSENIDDLNKYRSGILHKRGIADLQPHNYVDIRAEDAPFQKIFSVLAEQQAQNTAVLLGVLALLTDRLMELAPPLETEIQWHLENVMPVMTKSIEKRKAEIQRELSHTATDTPTTDEGG